jgi:uncharacterized protein
MMLMNKCKVGVISDTHGLLRDEALKVLKGSDLIIHAGDIGNSELLKELGNRAPLVAVRGNCDKGTWANELNKNEVVEVGDALIYVIHNIDELNLDPVASGFSVVISGHSHKPGRYMHNNVLFLNPGSAGPRRFKLPVSVAILNIRGHSVDVELCDLFSK